MSVDDLDDASASFRFHASQLNVFSGLASSMRNCSWAYAALAVGNVFVNALEAVEQAHAHHSEAAAAAAAAVSAAAAAAVTPAAAEHGAAAAAVSAVAAAAVHHVGGGGPSVALLLEELLRAVSLSDVAFCVSAIIPAALIAYSAGPFARLARSPDEPHMALALKGLGRLSLSLQQLAWTSGSVGLVVLLEAAETYPPLLGVASGACLALAAARGAALWWVLSRHSASGQEVAATLAALRGPSRGRGGGGGGVARLSLLDRAAAWLALGALLQAEPGIHANGHANGHGSGAQAPFPPSPALSPASPSASPSAAVSAPGPHYVFTAAEERVLRSLVEAGHAGGLALALQALATLALGVADAATSDPGGLVSGGILAAQKAANAALLFGASAAFDKALHNDDGLDDSAHLLEGLGGEQPPSASPAPSAAPSDPHPHPHGGLVGLFDSMAVLSWALLLAGGAALLVPSLEESPLGVLAGEGLMHGAAEVLVRALGAL